MSGLINAILTKKGRAKNVIQFVSDRQKKLEESHCENDILIRKKSNRMVQALSTHTDKAENDFVFMQKFYEYMGKIIDKIESFEGDASDLHKQLEWVDQIKPIVLFDIDDTLRDASHRMDIRKVIEGLKEQKSETDDIEEKIRLAEEIDNKWNDFFIAGFDDTPKEDVINLCNMYYDAGFDVRIRTGASQKFEERTKKYLADAGVKYNHLRMRKEGVRIPDYRLKPAWISKYDLGQNVFASYDDRVPLNENYRKKGVVNAYLVDKDFNVDEHIKMIQKDFDDQVLFLTPTEEKAENKTKRRNRP